MAKDFQFVVKLFRLSKPGKSEFKKIRSIKNTECNSSIKNFGEQLFSGENLHLQFFF